MKNNFTDKYFYLTTYYVSSETDTESDSIYDGNEFNRAKLEFDSANISDFKSDYGGTILFRKKVDKYKFIGDLENGEYEISDFPFEDYYNDSDYYQLIEEGEYEYVDSKEINPINKYSEDLLIDVQHHYKNIYGNIKYNNIVVDNGKDFYDDDYKEYGCIQLRIADHSENVKNIDKFGDCDYYISVVIADKDNTKGKFSTSIFERRMNEVELKFNSDNTFDEVINKIENAITEGKEYVLNKKKMKFDSNKPDIRYDNGGEIENLILQGIIDLKFYETTQEHAKEYGLKSNKPIFVQNLCVSEKNRLKGIGNKVLEYIENYAQKNGNDVIFGYVANNASFSKDSRNTYFCDIDTIKNWLHSKGYAINNDNNDFHKQIATNRTFDKGGSVRLSKTPAPKKDRIYGSKINKPFSASSSEKAKSIKLDDKVIKSIKNILKKHNSKEGSIKIPLSTAKAVVRRGMGAYSVSHRPTISKGKKNSRVAWGLARLNAFVYKVQNGESKSGKYNQDDDLISEISNKFKDGGSVSYKYFLVLKKKKPVFKVKFSKYNKDTEKDMSAMLDKLHDMGYKLKVISEKEYNEFDNNKVNKEDVAEFTRNWTFYKEGGVITDEQEETYNKWKKLVNMSASELKKFLDSEEGKIAGLSAKEADELGVDYGRESAKWILKMKAMPYKEWTPNMWRWAKKQISFISRMTGNKGKLYDEKGNRTRKYLSLLVWGNNPLKNKK